MTTREIAEEIAVYVAKKLSNGEEAKFDHVESLITRAVEGERERCARVAELEQERIKHTSHRDGLGMGDQQAEQVCNIIAAAIRAHEDK